MKSDSLCEDGLNGLPLNETCVLGLNVVPELSSPEEGKQKL